MEPILSVRDLTIRFGGVVALDAFSMDVPEGCIFGLIGPNGAGKTTCFNCISGLYRPTHGSVRFGQAELTRLPRHGDRKSTRLNSSHLVISYAVFCLKKKKNTTHIAFSRTLRSALTNPIV